MNLYSGHSPISAEENWLLMYAAGAFGLHYLRNYVAYATRRTMRGLVKQDVDHRNDGTIFLQRCSH